MSYLKKSTNKNDNSDDMSIDGYSDGSSVLSEDGHNSDQFPLNEDDNIEDPTIKIESQNTFQSGATDGIIDLSDSDDDDEGEENTDTKHIPTTTATTTISTTIPTALATKKSSLTYMFPVRIMTPSILPNKPNHTPFTHLRGKLTGRAALKQTLMKRVVIASKENLCKQMNIKTNMLALYQEIVDKCRYVLLYYIFSIIIVYIMLVICIQ